MDAATRPPRRIDADVVECDQPLRTRPFSPPGDACRSGDGVSGHLGTKSAAKIVTSAAEVSTPKRRHAENSAAGLKAAVPNPPTLRLIPIGSRQRETCRRRPDVARHPRRSESAPCSLECGHLNAPHGLRMGAGASAGYEPQCRCPLRAGSPISYRARSGSLSSAAPTTRLPPHCFERSQSCSCD